MLRGYGDPSGERIVRCARLAAWLACAWVVGCGAQDGGGGEAVAGQGASGIAGAAGDMGGAGGAGGAGVGGTESPVGGDAARALDAGEMARDAGEVGVDAAAAGGDAVDAGDAADVGDAVDAASPSDAGAQLDAAAGPDAGPGEDAGDPPIVLTGPPGCGTVMADAVLDPALDEDFRTPPDADYGSADCPGRFVVDAPGLYATQTIRIFRQWIPANDSFGLTCALSSAYLAIMRLEGTEYVLVTELSVPVMAQFTGKYGYQCSVQTEVEVPADGDYRLVVSLGPVAGPTQVIGIGKE